MLKSLHIKNVVLIEQLSLDFSRGLSALTGETGAGKSILLDSLGLALGSRADSSLVRRGSDQSSVTAEFELPADHPANIILKEQEMETSTTIILRRTLASDGRSKAFINDEPVSISLLKSLGETLVDIHGQFETYGLLNPALHRQVLDDYADATNLLSLTKSAYDTWQDKIRRLEQAKAEAEKAAMNEAWLRDSVKDLEALDPQAGEEEELLGLRQKLQNRDTIIQAISFAEEALAGEEGSDARIAQAWKALNKVADKVGEEEIKKILEVLDRASAEIQTAHRQIESLMRDVDSAEHSLETIEDRLYALRALARKHHCQTEDLPALYQDFSAKLKLMDHQDHVIGDLEKEIVKARSAYQVQAEKLHDKRLSVSGKLDKLVNKELAPLKMEKARFQTSIVAQKDETQWGPNGYDAVAFLVTTNDNADPAPLNKIASGGEMARFMLALKVVLAEAATQAATYVFDEIDTGIGGATASAVGERLARLAQQHQVLVVTHSPQVAARADHHWVVSKKDAKTSIIALKGKDRQEEIARMLSGSEITKEARAAAGKLLEVAA
ncbi:MAG: DNA repair protein RecN [Micavibrio aeruginosavorus]|uniref:DNA repair protein RecN n=1 Tax=Micavibrio aeruginosavorus TaxID=349221 RepID=A0A2W5FKU6_9BACT|nr:MAG: DNA repair protein RecN [Micavibrio aeruginosavorus]